MAFDYHLRLTCSGIITESNSGGAVVERFAFRVNLSNPSQDSLDTFTEERAEDYAADAVAFFGREASAISGVARLEEVKLASIKPDGTYRDEPFIVEVGQRGGGMSGMLYPPQVALAVSLTTDRRGQTGKGRFYLPVPTTQMAPSGLINSAVADGVRDSVQTFLNALNNVPGIDSGAPKVTVASSKGYNSDVTGVRVGRVLDTIRSRRSSIPESYSGVVAVS